MPLDLLLHRATVTDVNITERVHLLVLPVPPVAGLK